MKNKLAEMPPLPDEAEEPIVSLVPPMQREAVMWLVSRSPYDPNRVRQIVKDQVEPFLKRVPGVGGLLIFGGEEREIHAEAELRAFCKPEGLLWVDVQGLGDRATLEWIGAAFQK